MTHRLMVIAAITAVVSASALAQAAPLAALDQGVAGLWMPADKSAVIEVAPCSNNTSKLCAVVIEETLAAGESSLLGQVVVKDLVRKGKNRWRGRFVIDGADLSATARLTSPSQLEFQICLAFMCETEKYTRPGAIGIGAAQR